MQRLNAFTRTYTALNAQHSSRESLFSLDKMHFPHLAPVVLLYRCLFIADPHWIGRKHQEAFPSMAEREKLHIGFMWWISTKAVRKLPLTIEFLDKSWALNAQCAGYGARPSADIGGSNTKRCCGDPVRFDVIYVMARMRHALLDCHLFPMSTVLLLTEGWRIRSFGGIMNHDISFRWNNSCLALCFDVGSEFIFGM